MKTVAHLIDDARIGGVTKGLISSIEAMRGHFDCRQLAVDPTQPLPPAVNDDVVVVHYTPSWKKLPFLALLRGQRNAQPIVFVEHSYTAAFEKLHVRKPWRFRRMLKATYSLCDVVVAVSEGQGRWLLETGVVPRSKLVVIRSASDVTHLEDLPPPVRKPGPLRLAAYGRYCEQKGFDTLIEAFGMLPRGLATLTLAGYGPDEAQLREKAAGIEGIEIRGLVTDLRAFLSEFDGAVIPSRYEAFGQVAVEVRAAARPVIATDVDGLTEQISDRCGILVPADDASSLAAAIKELAERDIAEMGLESRRSAEGHFQEYLRRWQHLLSNLDNDGGISSLQAHAA